MNRRLGFSPEAEQDIREAVAWYRARQPGVARAFRKAVQAATEEVRVHPFHYAVREGDVRHFVLDGWPYSILYLVLDDVVAIVSVFHDRRDPMEWKMRL